MDKKKIESKVLEKLGKLKKAENTGWATKFRHSFEDYMDSLQKSGEIEQEALESYKELKPLLDMVKKFAKKKSFQSMDKTSS
jgi:hypothetical protein